MTQIIFWKTYPSHLPNMDEFSRNRSASPLGKLKFRKNIWVSFPGFSRAPIRVKITCRTFFDSIFSCHCHRRWLIGVTHHNPSLPMLSDLLNADVAQSILLCQEKVRDRLVKEQFNTQPLENFSPSTAQNFKICSFSTENFILNWKSETKSAQ